MPKGFRDFILRGNVIELAIAVVIGTAFTALVSGFTKFIINPIIAAAGGHSVNGLAFQLVSGNPATVVDIGALLTTFITFGVTAAVVYFVFVVPMNRLSDRRNRNKVAEEIATAPTELELLIQIRDLLTAQNAGRTDARPDHL